MDMEALKSDYCAGVLSIQDVADKHGIPRTTLSELAKREGWKRQKRPSKKSVQNANGRMNGRKNGRAKNTPEAASVAGDRSEDNPSKSKKTLKTKRNSRSGNPHPTPRFEPQNRASLKHGGYARRLLTSDANLEDAAALTLEDELLRVRAANLEAAENIGRWKTQLADADEETQKTLLAKIEGANKAMDRNTARIESLETTLTLGRKAEAETWLKWIAKDKGLFELEQERELAPLEKQRRDLVNKKIQADIERLNSSGATNEQTIIHNSMPIEPDE